MRRRLIDAIQPKQVSGTRHCQQTETCCEVIQYPWAGTCRYQHSQIRRYPHSEKHTHTLKWSHHIHEISKKAKLQLWLRPRSMPEEDQGAVLPDPPYIPIMEHANIIWNPHTHANINRLEVVQRCMLCLLCVTWLPITKQHDRNLGWPKLLERRAEAIVVMMYSIKNSVVDIHSGVLPMPWIRSRLHTPYTRRGNPRCCMLHNFVFTLTYERSFVQDAAKLWNSSYTDIWHCTYKNGWHKILHSHEWALTECKTATLYRVLFRVVV